MQPGCLTMLPINIQGRSPHLSMHKHHMLETLLEALTLPSCCAKQKSCSRSYRCRCLEASLSACAHVNCLSGPENSLQGEKGRRLCTTQRCSETGKGPALTFRVGLQSDASQSCGLLEQPFPVFGLLPFCLITVTVLNVSVGNLHCKA